MSEEVLEQLRLLRDESVTKEGLKETMEAESKRNADQFATLEKLGEESEAVKASVESLRSSIEDRGMTLPGAEAESENYQVGNVLRAFATGQSPEKVAPLEWDMHLELMKANEGEAGRRLEELTGRSLNTLSDVKGGFFVPEEISSTWYENFREMDIAASAGFTRVSPAGIFKIPKKTANTTAYRTGENGSPSASDISMGILKLEPHRLSARTFMTLEQMIIGDSRMEAMNRRDIGESVVLKRGYDTFYGSGGNNEPLGIYNHSGVVNLSLNATTDGDLTYDDVLDLIQGVRSSKALIDDGSLRFVSGRSAVWNRMLKSKGTDGHYIFPPGKTFADMLPYPAIGREDFPVAADGSDVFFGRFSEVIQATWGGIYIQESETATDGTNNALTQGGKHMVTHTWDDSGVVRPESIVYSSHIKFQN